jgi:hypothetical protein
MKFPQLDDGLIKVFESGATRSPEPLEDPEGFLSPFVIDRFNTYMAKHRVQTDGEIRASDNWQKGMPKRRYMRSMWRHFLQVWREWRDPHGYLDDLEEALCALMFNVQGMLLEVLIERGEIKRPRAHNVEEQEEDNVSKQQ